MANEKISQLPAGSPALSTDQIPIARSGANFFLTVAQILASALGAVNFSALTTGVNTQAAMTVGTGAVISATGSGQILATNAIPSFFTPSRVALGSPVSLTANTQTTVLTVTVTFPAGAGTYRALLHSGCWLTVGPNAAATAIIDVTNNKAFASANAQNANGSGFIGCAGAELTSQTYTAGQVVTFHLDAIANANSTATVNSALFSFSPAEATFLSVTPVLSN